MKKLNTLFFNPKTLVVFFCLFLFDCQDSDALKTLSDLPKTLKEVSGNETIANSSLIWMLNDGGNSSKIYGVSKKGNIKKEVKILAKNHDWEDLTSDEEGNLYIGDFGNNESKRKNLVILKVKHADLLDSKKAKVERIQFHYPQQKRFPPKKKQLFFDAESFFYHNKSFCIFTKSRVKNKFGKTSLYRIPAKVGNHEAEFISEFNHCNDLDCWITSADISDDKRKIALLTPSSVIIFSEYQNDDFFTGKQTEIFFKTNSQKEGVCFKDNNTLFITDEKAHGSGGNLYELKLSND